MLEFLENVALWLFLSFTVYWCLTFRIYLQRRCIKRRLSHLK